MPIPLLEDFFPPKNLRNFTPNRSGPKFGSVEKTKIAADHHKDQIIAAPNIPPGTTAKLDVNNVPSGHNSSPPALPPKLRLASSSSRPQSFTKGTPCGSVALHRTSTDFTSNGLSVGLVFPTNTLSERPFAGKFISCDVNDSPSWFGTDRGLLRGSNGGGQKQLNLGPPMIYECVNEMEDFVETKGIASDLTSVTLTPYWKSPIDDKTAGGSLSNGNSPEAQPMPYGCDTLKRAANTNREVSRELFKKMEESRIAGKKPLRSCHSDSPASDQKFTFTTLSSVQSDPDMNTSPTKELRLAHSDNSSFRSSPKWEKSRTANSSVTGSPSLTSRSRFSDTSGYSASRSSAGDPTSEDSDWNRPQQRGNIVSFCADELMDTDAGENVFSDGGTPVVQRKFSAPTTDYESFMGDTTTQDPDGFSMEHQMKFHFEPDQTSSEMTAAVEREFDMVYAVPDKRKKNVSVVDQYNNQGFLEGNYEDFVFTTTRCAPVIPPPLPSVPPPVSDDEDDGEVQSVLLKEENFYEEMNPSKSSPEGWLEEDYSNQLSANGNRGGYETAEWFPQRQANGKPTPPRPPPKVVQVHPYQQTSVSPQSTSPSSESLKISQPPSPNGMKSAVSHGAINSVGRIMSPVGSCKSPPPPLPPKPNIAAIQQMFGGSQSDLKNLHNGGGGVKIVLKRSDDKFKTPQGTFTKATGKLGNVPMVVTRDLNDNTYATPVKPPVPRPMQQQHSVQNSPATDISNPPQLHKSQVTVNSTVVSVSQPPTTQLDRTEVDGRAQKLRRGSIDAKCEMLKAYLVENTDDVQLRNLLQNERCTSVEYLETVIKDSPRNGAAMSGARIQLPMDQEATNSHTVVVQKRLPDSANQQAVSGAQQDAEVLSQISELEARKVDLITSLTRKLKILEVELNSVKEEIDMNDKLGESVLQSIETSTASDQQKEKFLKHIDETNSILQLLLKLSSQLVKLEDSMKSLSPDSPAQTRQTLQQRHKRLTQQLLDAKCLKEGIDRRSESICSLLKAFVSEEQFQDYTYFIRQKSKLVMDANEISEKIKIGEQQKRALEQFSQLQEAKIVMRV